MVAAPFSSGAFAARVMPAFEVRQSRSAVERQQAEAKLCCNINRLKLCADQL